MAWAREALVFLDGSGRANNFEGVAKYTFGSGMALYAIGDAIFDSRATADDNANDYFAFRLGSDATGHLTNGDRTRGSFKLVFSGNSTCRKPDPFPTSNLTFIGRIENDPLPARFRTARSPAHRAAALIGGAAGRLGPSAIGSSAALGTVPHQRSAGHDLDDLGGPDDRAGDRDVSPLPH